MAKPKLIADNSAFGEWRRKMVKNDRHQLVDCFENVYYVLTNHPTWSGVIGLDEFGNCLKIRKPPDGVDGFEPGEWTTKHTQLFRLWLLQVESLRVRAKENIMDAIGLIGEERRFHPVVDYLEQLKWDGTMRLGRWLQDCLAVDECRALQGCAANHYVGLAGKFFLMGMVARVYDPGCIMRQVLVLEGTQWRGKSTAMKLLGGDWYSDTPFVVGDKDAFQALRGKWLYEIAELDAFNRSEATRVKAFISSTSDNYRAPYEARNRDWPRQCVFVATTNQFEYFKDPSGNTRFMPVIAGDANLQVLADMRDQLFAEAVLRYKQGRRRYPTRFAHARLFAPEQDAREIEDPRYAKVSRFLRETPAARVSMETLVEDCLGVKTDRIDNARQLATVIGWMVHRCGWVKRRGERGYFYERGKKAARPLTWGKEREVPF